MPLVLETLDSEMVTRISYLLRKKIEEEEAEHKAASSTSELRRTRLLLPLQAGTETK